MYNLGSMTFVGAQRCKVLKAFNRHPTLLNHLLSVFTIIDYFCEINFPIFVDSDDQAALANFAPQQLMVYNREEGAQNIIGLLF
jgi:hypothetical protein